MWPFTKTRKLLAVTRVAYLKETFPIVAAKDCLPAWYKDMPLTIEKGQCPVQHSITNKWSTIKTCSGVDTLLHKGFIIPAWEDISIVVYPDGTHSSVGAYTNPATHAHDKRQMPPSMQHYSIIKILTPWFLYGDATEYMVVPTAYHTSLSQKHFMPSGVVNYKYQHTANVFIAAKPKEEPYEILIKGGDPLAHVVPLTEDKIDLELKYDPTHIVRAPGSFFFLHAYNRYVNWMKRKNNAG